MPISVPAAGELKRRITLFRRIDDPADDEAWAQSADTDIATVWAKHEPTGSVYWGAVQTEDKATDRFWIRAVAGKTDAFSISHGVLIKDVQTGRVYRPVRVTDANGAGLWTIIEACELGENYSETISVETES